MCLHKNMLIHLTYISKMKFIHLNMHIEVIIKNNIYTL